MRRALFFAFLASLGCVSCGESTGSKPVPSVDAGTTPAEVEPSALVVANWNLEWFGSTAEGPTDEQLQQSNVGKVMKAVDADLWSNQEIVDVTAYQNIASGLGNYQSLVASDPSVENGGSQIYSPTDQKLGVMYRSSRLTLKAARIILRDDLGPFNGRPPLEVDFETKPGGTAITVIVVHLAAGTDQAAYDKRKTAAAALKTFLDAKPSGALVMVAGDFNDGLEKSSYAGSTTPFADLLADSAYVFATKGLTSPRYPRVIDHQLLTDDFANDVVPATAKVTDGDTLVSNFVNTTSDHDPVSVRYSLP